MFATQKLETKIPKFKKKIKNNCINKIAILKTGGGIYTPNIHTKFVN